MAINDPDKYNDGYTLEAMHTAHILCDTWDRHVAEARCCNEFPDVKDAALKAADAMYHVYQLIGQKFDSTTA
jgi:hypothetical protein